MSVITEDGRIAMGLAATVQLLSLEYSLEIRQCSGR
jgi:hypothetical protein